MSRIRIPDRTRRLGARPNRHSAYWRRHYGPSGHVTAAMPHIPAQRRFGEHKQA